ncbi:MAG TPA: UDP-N-acetylmuramoyl-L-alanine--D-glutamate ligase, partial [Chthonomonadaceae bacterium]|nr:UDP-N-acetylmuramoyl-L-alanine--D-glutamate ligase [Chthonomonadaceae bacterium]
ADSLGGAAVEAAATGARCAFAATVDQALPGRTALVVTSPGVPASAPVLQAARERRIPIWSEIELAYRIARAPILAVTGTNGKTTTAMLLTAMLDESGKSAIVCGNVSADDVKRTLVEAAEAAPAEAFLVAEISSFQLEWVEKFAPRVAILTNVTADHLNRHRCFEEYVDAKARIFAAQCRDDWAVVGFDNPASRTVGHRDVRGRRIWFATQGPPPDSGPCAWLDGRTLLVRLACGAAPVAVMRADEMPETLPGVHSIANVLAAASAALAVGADPAAIRRAVRSFAGAAHRMERVGDVRGVRYVNNSMCTNVAAAVCSLEAMDRPTIVIAGGADKGLDFSPLAPVLFAKAKRVILIGAAADKMEAAIRAGGFDEVGRAESLEGAVEAAAAMAAPGDAVLLSPACASFDMFRDFEARGAAFRAAVRRLETQN